MSDKEFSLESFECEFHAYNPRYIIALLEAGRERSINKLIGLDAVRCERKFRKQQICAEWQWRDANRVPQPNPHINALNEKERGQFVAGYQEALAAHKYIENFPKLPYRQNLMERIAVYNWVIKRTKSLVEKSYNDIWIIENGELHYFLKGLARTKDDVIDTWHPQGFFAELTPVVQADYQKIIQAYRQQEAMEQALAHGTPLLPQDRRLAQSAPSEFKYH